VAMDADWLEAELFEAREYAFRECQRCRARERGTCSDECRFWPFTATDSEREQSARRGANMRPRTKREWTGPRRGGAVEDDVDGEQ